MSYEIFVSHSHVDNDFCVRLVEGLHSRLDDPDIFFDKGHMVTGDQWFDRLQREVEKRPIFVVILSPDSVQSPWVRMETNQALYDAARKPTSRWVMPVRYRECRPRDLAPVLEQRHFADCSTDVERGLDELAAAIRETSSGRTVHWLPPTSRRTEMTTESEEAVRAAADIHDAFQRRVWSYVSIQGDNVLSRPGNETNAELYAETGYGALQVAKTTNDGQRLERAVELLEQATTLAPQRSDFLIWKAEAYTQRGATGDMDRAVSAWNDAVRSTSSYTRKIAVFAQEIDALQRFGKEGLSTARDCADQAVGLLATLELDTDFSYGWLYWADTCATIKYYDRAIEAIDHKIAADPSDTISVAKRDEWKKLKEPITQPDSAVETARVAALDALVQIVQQLRGEDGRLRDFPTINDRLVKRGIRYRDLAFARFTDFMRFAADQGKVRVEWTKPTERVYLPDEPVPQSPQSPTPVTKKASPAPEPRLAQQPAGDSRIPALRLADLLDKSLPFITFTLLNKRFAEAGYPATMLLAFSAEHLLEPCKTDDIYDYHGVARQHEALRLIREPAEVQQLYAGDPSSWQELREDTRNAFSVIIRGLAVSHPYLTWNMVKSFLHAHDSRIDWDVTFASAVDAGVLSVGNLTVKNRQTGGPLTVRGLTWKVAEQHTEQVKSEPVRGWSILDIFRHRN